jgi:hypothetical protein
MSHRYLAFSDRNPTVIDIAPAFSDLFDLAAVASTGPRIASSHAFCVAYAMCAAFSCTQLKFFPLYRLRQR